MNDFVLAFIDANSNPMGIMLGINTMLAGAVGWVYRDQRKNYTQCVKDRERLWSRITELESRIFPLDPRG